MSETRLCLLVRDTRNKGGITTQTARYWRISKELAVIGNHLAIKDSPLTKETINEEKSAILVPKDGWEVRELL